MADNLPVLESTSAKDERMAQIYLEIWLDNPKITRKEALIKMRERGIKVRNITEVSRITNSRYFRDLQASIVVSSRTALIETLANGVVDVLAHQISLAKGEGKVYDKDSVAAARVVTDLWRSLNDNVENAGLTEENAKPQKVLLINNYYAGTPDGDADIIDAPIEFDPEDVKASFIDQSSLANLSD